MKIRKYITMAAAAFGLLSCTKESVSFDPGEANTDVYMYIDGIENIYSPDSRAIGEKMTAGAVQLEGLFLIFCQKGNPGHNEQITVTKDYRKGSSEWADLTTPGKGLKIKGIPKTTGTVYVIGNVQDHQGFRSKFVAGQDVVTTINNNPLMLRYLQTSYSGGKSNNGNVPLYGRAELTAGSGENEKNANVRIAPSIARIQVGNIQCEDLGTQYKKIEIDRVGVYNTWNSLILSGTGTGERLDESKFCEPGTEVTGKSEWGWSSGVTNYSWSWDFFSQRITLNSKDNVHNPSASGASQQNTGRYVYHLAVTPISSGVFPQFRMYTRATVNVDNGQEHAKNKFITVNLKNSANSGILQPGYIYDLDVKFREFNISPWNPENKYKVNLTLSAQKWTVVNISTPDWQ